MKQKLQKYLSGEREGFSLVELIIVIAIMAILIGIVALAVIPYLEKSRVGKDQQTVDTVYSAFQSAIADQKITGAVDLEIKDGSCAGSLASNTNFVTFMAKALNASSASDIGDGTAKKLESANAKNNSITCKMSADGEITVFATGDKTIVSSNKSTPTLNQ